MKPTYRSSNFHLYSIKYLLFTIYLFSFKAETYSHKKQFISFNSHKSCAYNQEQFSLQQCVVVLWLIRSILKTWNEQKTALGFGKKTRSEFDNGTVFLCDIYQHNQANTKASKTQQMLKNRVCFIRYSFLFLSNYG